MSLIKVDSKYPETETRFSSLGGELNKPIVTTYIQSFKGKDVARFIVTDKYTPYCKSKKC